MQHSRENELGEAPVGGLFWRLVIPSVVAQLITLLYNMVDRIYIGHISDAGSLPLTGVGVCMPLTIIISAFASLVCSGGAPRASFYMGQGDTPRAERTLGACALLVSVLSVFITILTRYFSEPLLLLFGASEATLPYAADYFNTYVWGTLFVELSVGLVLFISAQGFTTISMTAVLTGAVLNIILDPLFIFTFKMGVRGAAVATVISQAVSAVFVLCFLCGKRTNLRLYRKNLRFDWSVLLPALSLGISPFTMQITECFVSVCFNRSLLYYGGDDAVGTMTIFTTLMQAVTLPLMGVSNGAQPITSYNYGAGKYDRVRQSHKLLMLTALAYSLVFWLALIINPRLFVSIFAEDAAFIEYSCDKVKYFFPMLWVMGLQYSGQSTFLALGNAKTSFILAVLRKIFLLIPLIIVMPLVLPDPVTAVFLAEPVADTLAALTTTALFYRFYKKSLVTEPKTAK